MTNNTAGKDERHNVINGALNLAISRVDMAMIKLAMEQGADAKILLDAGIKAENMDMIVLALEKGADANALLFAGVDRGTPKAETLKYVFRSIAEDHAERPKISLSWVKTALDHGADPNVRKRAGYEFDWTVLHFAQDHFKANREIIELLIDRGARVDEPSPIGTPLMRAVTDGDAKAVEFFLSKGANPAFICEKLNSFPMKALERSDKFRSGRKAELLSLMMHRLPAASTDAAPPPAEPGATTEAIEISKPLELKRPEEPKPSKSFSL